MQWVNTWKICTSKWANIFQMTNAGNTNSWVGKKDPFKVQDRLMDFSVTDYEIQDTVSYSALQLDFKTCYLVSFGAVIK